MKRNRKFFVLDFSATRAPDLPVYRLYTLLGSHRTFTVYTGGE